MNAEQQQYKPGKQSKGIYVLAGAGHLTGQTKATLSLLTTSPL